MPDTSITYETLHGSKLGREYGEFLVYLEFGQIYLDKVNFIIFT